MTTLFRDMTALTRKTWLQWADSHDWGQGALPARFEGDEIVVHSQEEHGPGQGWQLVAARFTNPRDLRAWAGY